MQHGVRWTASAVALLLAGTAAAAPPAPAPAPPPARAANARESIEAWVFKPKAAPYVAPNRPVWHVAEIVSHHRGQTDWVQPVVADRWFRIHYVSMSPGKATRTSFEADTIAWFVVQSGQVRFTIKGQEPFIAARDVIVQVPMRTPYSMETVGDAPSVRLEVRVAEGATVYPVADNPTPPAAPPGFAAVKVNFTAPSRSAATPVRTSLDFDREVIGATTPPPSGGGANFFVRDAHGFAVPIRSAPTNVAATDIGHFHTGLAEFWYVLEGDMDVRIEGVPGLVHAHQGDLVYAPMGRYHRTIMVGSPMSTRLAMGSVTDSGASFTPAKGE